MTIKKHIPNLLTLSRIVLALGFPFLEQRFWIWIIVIAALTEWLDGVLARYFHAETPLGKMLDPIADKTLLISLIFTFLYYDLIQLWELLLVSLRDLTILSGTLWITYRKQWPRFKLMAPHYSGKVATFAQYVLFFNIILLNELWNSILVVTIFISAWASAHYINIFLRQGKKYNCKT